MTELKMQNFDELCRLDLIMHQNDGDSIGTYSEKRIHRILKRAVTEKAECYEVKVGKYVADVVCDNTITEIQTSSFKSLSQKIKYYLEQTDFCVRVICPIIVKKTIIRADRESGDIIRIKKSPKRESDIKAVANMYHIAFAADNPRFELVLARIEVEEYRFSEAMRYRKKGRYDNDVRPVRLISLKRLAGIEEYSAYIPKELFERELTISEFSDCVRLCGREAYYALGFFTQLGKITCRAEGRKKLYSSKK